MSDPIPQPPQDFWVLAAKNSESLGLLALAYFTKQIVPIFDRYVTLKEKQDPIVDRLSEKIQDLELKIEILLEKSKLWDKDK